MLPQKKEKSWKFCIKQDETVETCLQRELREELNYQDFKDFEYICSHEVPSEDMRTHMFAKKVTEEAFFEIENAARKVPRLTSPVYTDLM